MAAKLTAAELKAALDREADPQQAQTLSGFFKTGQGQYGEGDVFLGLKVPVVRRIAGRFRGMAATEAGKLLRSEVHEHRFAALALWVDAFQRGDAATRGGIFSLYLANTQYINNWDLVDCSAPQIVGQSLPSSDTSFLETLAESPLLWERRIAILATFTYIRGGVFKPTLRICELLLSDSHDLMHKACGWMLREVGKRDRRQLETFLNKHAADMPRTMLRYALEHFDQATRGRYMLLKAAKTRRP